MTTLDINQLEAYINGKINAALESTVKPIAEDTMKEHVQVDVYNPYTPHPVGYSYVRTGKLLKDVKGTVEGNTLILEDTRNQESDTNGRDVISIIENGGHYDWGKRRNLDQEIGKRPFVENTYIELANGKARNALAEGLRSQGLIVE